jgi:hypothetical protein
MRNALTFHWLERRAVASAVLTKRVAQRTVNPPNAEEALVGVDKRTSEHRGLPGMPTSGGVARAGMESDK